MPEIEWSGANGSAANCHAAARLSRSTRPLRVRLGSEPAQRVDVGELHRDGPGERASVVEFGHYVNIHGEDSEGAGSTSPSMPSAGQSSHASAPNASAASTSSSVMTMPRSVDDILKHADELAARFEDCDPDPSHELNPDAVHLLRQAVQERSEAERHIAEAIRKAREVGMSWSVIGAFVGTTGEAVRPRYGGKTA